MCGRPGHFARDGWANLRRKEMRGKCFICLEPGHYVEKYQKPRNKGANVQVNVTEAVPIASQPPNRDTRRKALEGKVLIL